MGTETKIQWTDHTFNPWRGCTKVHEGCQFCYAEAGSKRNPNTLGIWGNDGTRVVAIDSTWNEPLKWNRQAEKEGRRHRVFCASLADIFEDWQGPIHDHRGTIVTQIQGACEVQLTMHNLRHRLFALIDQTPMLDWQILTKRPENILRMWPEKNVPTVTSPKSVEYQWTKNARRSNVWLGTSVSMQKHLEVQIAPLLQCRNLAPALFVSAEPLLESIDLEPWMQYPPLTENYKMTFGMNEWRGINWLIIGGESGVHARPFDIRWARSIIEQCRSAGVPVFMKQLGSHTVGPDPDSIIDIHDEKGGEPAEWPEDLRVREFPTCAQQAVE